MPKSPTTEQTPAGQNVAEVSRKREITAVATATTVTVILGVATNVLIGKISAQVHDRIAPKPKTESTTN